LFTGGYFFVRWLVDANLKFAPFYRRKQTMREYRMIDNDLLRLLGGNKKYIGFCAGWLGLLGMIIKNVIVLLDEGLFNLNNSTLMRYSFSNGTQTPDYFKKINKRGLGDTANDMAIYGSKLYVVVNVSSQIEVIDLKTGTSLKQIGMLTGNGSSRQPRYITFFENKAYVCSFDGTVARIDTTSLAIEALTQVGRNPDGLCVQNNKLYVSNSGGLDNPNYDNTVSVIDIASFKEIKKIIVGSNPGKILADKYGDVYVVTRGNLQHGDYKLERIDSNQDKVVESFNFAVLNFAINDDYAYMYNYDYSSGESSIKVFNIKTELIERENFITDGTSITTPYGININPYNGNIYITDAYDYKVTGDLLCFSPQGRLQFKLKNIGLNPNTVAFSIILKSYFYKIALILFRCLYCR
jgi:YVTN family beta-propeller protein